jgi:hypothetical protein
VFCRDKIDGIDFVNVGRELSALIVEKAEHDNLQDDVNELLSRSWSNAEVGRYLALNNIGILFEPELKLNLRSLFESYSKDQTLFICDEGGVVDNTFHFFEPSSLYTVDLSGLAYTTID